MFRNCDPFGATDVCNHLQTVENEREGESVCVDCGLVLEPLYIEETFGKTEIQNYFDTTVLFITDVCKNACISDGVIPQAFSSYKKLRQELHSKFRDKDIAAYAIYETLNRLEIPRTAEEIQHFSGVKLKDIWLIEANVTVKTVLSEASSYVNRCCNLLSIEYHDQLFIRKAVNALQNCSQVGSLKTTCCVAVVIYLATKRCCIVLTLKQICEACGISTTSIHRILRKMRKDCLQELKESTALCWILDVL